MSIEKFTDPMMVCPQCGDIFPQCSEDQLEKWGMPECCGHDMLIIERNNMHKLIVGLNKLIKNLEEELVGDF